MLTRARAGALALSAIAALSASAATSAGWSDGTNRGVAADWRRVVAELRPDLFPRLKHGLANRPRAVFPVRGAVDYGGAAARFGNDRGDHIHEGQDLLAPASTPLVAARDGVVVEAGNGGGRGNYVAIFSPETNRTYVYLHMQAPASAPVGRRVRAGQLVGKVGCTGSCSGDHLHFEIRLGRGANGKPQDPLPFLKRWQRR